MPGSLNFRVVRITLLLFILFIVAMNSWLAQSRIQDWNRTVWVVLYPINADGRSDTQAYVNALDVAHFEDIQLFYQQEASRFNISLQSVVKLNLADQLSVQPPVFKESGGVISGMIWSLKMRWWSWWYDNWEGPEPDIRVYLRYFSPVGRTELGHSLGLQKGMIGLVNGFASVDYMGSNNFVIAHEMMHTLGASDKYDLTTNEPVYPDGFADPEQTPLLPQSRAEIMGGRVKVSPGWLLMPQHLNDVIVGPATAAEIGW